MQQLRADDPFFRYGLRLPPQGGSSLGGFWKYRVGDYRMISSIEDSAVQILVVKVGNRREV
jgi:mRNA interferase RelE/StbE